MLALEKVHERSMLLWMFADLTKVLAHHKDQKQVWTWGRRTLNYEIVMQGKIGLDWVCCQHILLFFGQGACLNLKG